MHRCERTPQPDRLTLVPEHAARDAWQQLADKPALPVALREVARAFATTKGKRKNRTVELATIGVDRTAARKLVTDISAIIGGGKRKRAVRLSEGRGGRSQYRFTAEFPDGLDAAGRMTVTTAFCGQLGRDGLMYVAAVHAPDHHNDQRNHHLHAALHDRPTRRIGDRWDFEIAEPVEGQRGRKHYPHRQNKVAKWSRDPEGGGHRDYGARMLAEADSDRWLVQRPVADIKKSWRVMAARFGIPGGYGPKLMRHSMATLIAQRGVPLTEIAIALGHAVLPASTRHYVIFSPHYLVHTRQALEDIAADLARRVGAPLHTRDTQVGSDGRRRWA